MNAMRSETETATDNQTDNQTYRDKDRDPFLLFTEALEINTQAGEKQENRRNKKYENRRKKTYKVPSLVTP